MRKSPEKPAAQYKIGTKKKGLDDNNYYILTDKNNRKRWVKEGGLFVIYKINPSTDNKYWNYGEFPSTWQWIGGGTTVTIQMLSDSVKYPREEQFMGNPKYTAEMRKILTTHFKELKDKKVIKYYKIVSTKGLHNYMKQVNGALNNEHSLAS